MSEQYRGTIYGLKKLQADLEDIQMYWEYEVPDVIERHLLDGLNDLIDLVIKEKENYR